MYKVKKYLGQNFLKSVPALKKIIETGEISREDNILEIGPGKGALTEKLLEKADHVIAVEKDRELFGFLKEKFSEEIEEKKLILKNDDILEFNPSAYRLEPRAYKIIANIPYNITGAILKKFLTEKNQPKTMVLMVQNEVAKRIMGRTYKYQGLPSVLPRVTLGKENGKESILSISVKAYGEPKMIMKVPARYFSPAPKVDSAIISIKNISRRIFIENKLEEEKFWKLIRAGFAHKRKKLSSNLKKMHRPETYLKNGSLASVFNGESLQKFLGNKRAEELTLADWINLAKIAY